MKQMDTRFSDRKYMSFQDYRIQNWVSRHCISPEMYSKKNTKKTYSVKLEYQTLVLNKHSVCVCVCVCVQTLYQPLNV